MTTLAEATSLAAGRGNTTALTMLHSWVTDPVNTCVVADGIVLRVDKDDLIILVIRVGVDPVTVQDTQVTANLANTLLGEGTQIAAGFQLVDTVMLGLSVNDTFGVVALAATSADSNTVNTVPLLGLEAYTTGFVRAGGAGDARDFRALAVFPSADTKQVTHNITLLLLPYFFQVLVRGHFSI